MGTRKKTYYTNSNDKQNNAFVKVLTATPNDTTIAIWPAGGTYHEITWPAVGSKTKELVKKADNIAEMQVDNDYHDYWIRAGKEALHNAKQEENWFSALLNRLK